MASSAGKLKAMVASGHSWLDAAERRLEAGNLSRRDVENLMVEIGKRKTRLHAVEAEIRAELND